MIQVMMRMYADDSKILRRLNTPDHVNQVQVSVNQSVIWASIWQMFYHYKQEISLKKIFGGSQILTILTQLSDEIPLYSLSFHAGKGCSV